MSVKQIPKKVFKQDQEQQENFKNGNQSGLLESESGQESKHEQFESQQQYSTLEGLIFKLNDEDHSEDQGIQDYKIGGYHPCHVGEVLINRYVLIQKLGWGHFSTVWLAKDFKFGNYTAVKIMKSSPHYLEASYDEVQILQKVAKNAFHPQWMKSLKIYEPYKQKYDHDDCHVLNLLNSFLYKGPYGNHFCMVFEILGVNLLEVLKRYDYKGLPLHLVKQITRQVLMGLDFLNRVCKVIHTDLKPQNVLLCLTEQQIRKIVQDGQLASKELYRDRLKLYRKKYGLGPQNQQIVEEQNDNGARLDAQTTQKIKQIKKTLEENNNLSKNQRRNLRKKITKLQNQPKNIQIQEPRKQKTAKELFSAFDTKLVMDKGPKLEKGFKVKIADLGNACWEHHHFATQIQTRQYRGPQVLTGSKYNISADMWSLACMTFQMLTGELLFNPRKDTNESFGKNDDHLAQMMELLGRFPKKFSLRGAKSKKYFAKDGTLIRIPKLQNWSLKDVMIAKYRFLEKQAEFFQNFMMPMLNCYPEKRTLSDTMLKHPWLYTINPQNYFMDKQTHSKIKMQRYDLDAPKQQIYQYQSQRQDGSVEDNGQDGDQLFKDQKMGDIRYIDRSFTDLGYIGYQDGIHLQKLDSGPNWQFQK